MRTGTLEIERWWQQLAPAERRSLRRPRERLLSERPSCDLLLSLAEEAR